MTFLLLLIRDLENPFGYYERNSGEDVSLRPIEDTAGRLAEIANRDSSTGSPHAERLAAPDAAPPRR